VDAKDVVSFIFLRLLPPLLYLLKIGLISPQFLSALKLFSLPAILLLGVALAKVLLFLFVCLLQPIADVRVDFSLLYLLLLQQTLSLLLFLHVYLQPPEPIFQ
jgi:hypothetical protein